jgi:cell division protein FtsQ
MRGLSARKSDRVVTSGRGAGRGPRRRAGAVPRRARAASRRRRGLRLSRWPWKRIAACLALLVIAAWSVHLWRTGAAAEAATAAAAEARRAALALSLRAGLSVREVYLEGREHAPTEVLREALGIERGDPILAIDPHAARERLESLGWVAAARVERRLPDLIYVRIVERRPSALWQHRGRLAVVDAAGTVISDHDIARFAALPLVVGDSAPQALPALLEVMAGAPDLAARVSAAVRVSGRRWNLRFDDRIDVKLPELGVEAAWARLVEMQRRGTVLERAISVLDLRQADRAVVRLPDEDDDDGQATPRAGGSDA